MEIYMAKEKKPDTTVAQNKKAYHDYFVDETYEAGISLFGTEVKSVREGRVNLKDSYISVKTGEAFLIGTHISPYEKGNIFNKDPLRQRKLLLHKREINKLIGLTQQQGYTLIPLKMYFKGSYVKVLIGLCRGKKNYDKREAIAQRDSKRQIERAMKEQIR
jgi:SsrA-binding protein